jgi:hypothetical protein
VAAPMTSWLCAVQVTTDCSSLRTCNDMTSQHLVHACHAGSMRADCTFRDFYGEEGPAVAANAESTVHFERCHFQRCTAYHAGLLLIMAGSHSSILVRQSIFEDNDGNLLSAPAEQDGTFVADEPYTIWFEAQHANSTAAIADEQSVGEFASADNGTYLALREVRPDRSLGVTAQSSACASQKRMNMQNGFCFHDR